VRLDQAEQRPDGLADAPALRGEIVLEATAHPHPRDILVDDQTETALRVHGAPLAQIA
jgi:hypothetical protein